MNEIPSMTGPRQRQVGLALLALLLAGCVGIEQPAERAARQDLVTIRGHHRLDAMTNALPALRATSTLGDFLTFAMLNQPRVQAAYFDWAASVERITVERSLPDPRKHLTESRGGGVSVDFSQKSTKVPDDCFGEPCPRLQIEWLQSENFIPFRV